MFKFNGHYGCHFCTVPGRAIGRAHSYYPAEQQGRTREQTYKNVFVDYAESLPSTEVSNVVGVKGRSAFCSIIDDLPITAP